MYSPGCSELRGADGKRALQAPALGGSRAGGVGLQHILLSIPQQLSGVFSAVPELMSFPPWQTASALLRLRYVTRRWGWVGARRWGGGAGRRAGGRVPAWAQDSVYFLFFAKEGGLIGTAEHQAHQGSCSFQDRNF